MINVIKSASLFTLSYTTHADGDQRPVGIASLAFPLKAGCWMCFYAALVLQLSGLVRELCGY